MVKAPRLQEGEVGCRRSEIIKRRDAVKKSSLAEQKRGGTDRSEGGQRETKRVEKKRISQLDLRTAVI